MGPAPAGTARGRHRSSRPSVPAPTGAQRLLTGIGDRVEAVGLDEHLDRWGSLPAAMDASFLDELERSGLRGHGGAWFPVGRKWRAVHDAGLRKPVVVANAAEGEPASSKDRLLVHRLPHLVLDGAMVAAATLRASRVYVHVPRAAVGAVEHALSERAGAHPDRWPVEVVVAPDRFLAGQESAVVNTIAGRRSLPSFQGLVPIRERGVGGRPTLVQNVETLAHVALVARFGATWFRTVGTPESPGTALLTVTGRWAEPRIVEAPLGTPLAGVLQLGPAQAGHIQGVLLGGYGGGWVTTDVAGSLVLTEEAARKAGSSIGAGVVVVLPAGVCPLAEVSRVVSYLEGQGAGQCGPCVNGLAMLASTVRQLAHQPSALRGGAAAIPALCDLVEGRGACRHPDGVARFVRTALSVYGEHVEVHLRRGQCQSSPAILPVPPGRPNGRERSRSSGVPSVVWATGGAG